MLLGGSLTLDACVIDSCSAAYGGGVSILEGLATMRGCSLHNNTASISGGGLHFRAHDSDRFITASLDNCSIRGNTAIVCAAGQKSRLHPHALY